MGMEREEPEQRLSERNSKGLRGTVGKALSCEWIR